MAELITDVLNTRIGFQKQKLKSADIPTKRVALGVLDCNINITKGTNSLKLNGKSGKQQSIFNKINGFGGQKFRIFADEEEGDENIFPASPQKPCSIEFTSPEENLEFSAKINKDTSLLLTELRNKDLCSDLVWCSPYRLDIYSYFKGVEQQYHPNANYMDKQTDITMNMRSVLVDWLVEVGEEYKLHPESLYLAVSYTDRFLSHMSVLRAKLQLVGTASMFISSKYEEIYPPELKDFVYITDDTYTKKQILRMEHLILRVLNFDLSVPTAYSFLQLYCSISNASQTVTHLSQYICELSLLDGRPFLKFLPSIVAAGSLALANHTLGNDMWDKSLEESSGYQLTDLTCVIMCLHDKYSSISTCPQQAISEKYKSSKFGCVTAIQPSKDLVFPDASS